MQDERPEGIERYDEPAGGWGAPRAVSKTLAHQQVVAPSIDRDALMLTTIRSHDEDNTAVFGLDDRYRGVFGRRDVVFMNKTDLRLRTA